MKIRLSNLVRWLLAGAALGGLTLGAVILLTTDAAKSEHLTFKTAAIKWGNTPDLLPGIWDGAYPPDVLREKQLKRSQRLHSYARFDMVAFSEPSWYAPQMNWPTHNAVHDSLVLLNQDIIPGQYLSAMHVNHYQKEGVENYRAAISVIANPDSRPTPFSMTVAEEAAYRAICPWPNASILYPGSWSYDWYVAMEPYLARTNGIDPATGLADTASAYQRNYTTNLLLPGCIEAIVEVFAKYKRDQFGHEETWVMIDFFSWPYPDFKNSQPPAYRACQVGEMDLDGDERGHSRDADEWPRLKAAFASLSMQLRWALPEVILIPNGAQMRDADLAHLTDGWYIEGFPKWHFGKEGPSFANALSPSSVFSLWQIQGLYHHRQPPIILLENSQTNLPLWPIAAVFGMHVCTIGNDERVDWPADVANDFLGAPEGPPRVENEAIIRDFEHGSIRLYNFTDTSYNYEVSR